MLHRENITHKEMITCIRPNLADQHPAHSQLTRGHAMQLADMQGMSYQVGPPVILCWYMDSREGHKCPAAVMHM